MTYDGEEPRGAFDDLLDSPGERRRSTRGEHEVAAMVSRAMAAIADGAPAGPRPRTCCRCEAQADLARKKGELVLEIGLVESWVHQGRRYFAATCVSCTDFEWGALWQRRYDAAEAKSNNGEMRRLTEVAHARQARGRRIPVRMAKEPGQHAGYDAR